ncbi:MAG: CAP domain-containing protein [Lacibacter sp.]
MRFIIFSLAFLFSVGAAAQGSVTLQAKVFVYNPPRDTSVWNWLERKPGFAGLSSYEQQLFYWTNIMRRNPSLFFETVIQEFLRQFPEAHTREVQDLAQDIKKTPTSLPMLAPDAALHRMATAHAIDLKNRGGIISHQSATGKSFAQRIKEYGTFHCAAENIYVGSNDPLEALIVLLIDHNVPNKGHRINLLHPAYGRMGVGWQQLKEGRSLLVQEFACP